MTPILLLPLGLAALAVAIVPLIIHLHRRTEQVPTDFAALRWLDPRPRPRRRVRFDNWPLLIARLSLIALLALLLAQPALYGIPDAAPRILVAPGVDPAPAVAAAGADAEVRWLAPGFPAIDGPAPAGPVPLSSLIRQFDAELPPRARLTVVVPAILEGVDADHLRLTRAVRWRVVPGAMALGPTAGVAVPYLAVRYPAGDDRGARYLRAAAAAWAAPGARGRYEATASEALPDRAQLLVWLRSGPVPAAVFDWIERGGSALLGAEAIFAMPGATVPLWRDATGLPLIEGGGAGRGRVLRLTRPLSPAAMPQLLEPDFPARLRTALMPSPPPPARVFAQDYAPVGGVAPYPQPPWPLAPWLAVAIALVLLIERWLATGRRRTASS